MPPPSKYAPEEIQNNMFLPLMKKALMGAYGADAKTNVSLVLIIYSVNHHPTPPLS